jgi:opacity protein-like surface antigen
VEKNWKGILRKWNLLIILIFLLMVGSMPSYSSGDEKEGKMKWGFSLSSGTDQKSRNDLVLYGFLPRIDFALHRNWDFEFEGNFSYYAISNSKNLYLLGLNGNILFKPIQWNRGSLFLIGGVGLAYNNNSDRQVRDIGDSHATGIAQIGSGINYNIGKGLWLRGEYRFHHISDPFRKDSGINTHDLNLGISF